MGTQVQECYDSIGDSGSKLWLSVASLPQSHHCWPRESSQRTVNCCDNKLAFARMLQGPMELASTGPREAGKIAPLWFSSVPRKCRVVHICAGVYEVACGPSGAVDC